MIYFVSGTPGAGKTLFTIKLLSEEKVRPIYYYKIDLTDAGKLALPNWIPITKEELHNWQALPDGCIVLVDEAHTVFPQRTGKDKVPAYIEDLAEHRHRGMDFYIVDQHPKDLDVFIRRRTYQHWHYMNVFGMDSSTKLAWQGFQDDQPDDYHAKQRAETTRHSFPKEVYAWYHSAEVHTKKKRVPWQLYAIPLLLLSVVGTIYAAYAVFMKPAPPDPVPASHPAAQPSRSAGVVGAAPGAVAVASVATVNPVSGLPLDAEGLPVFTTPPRARALYRDFRNAAVPDYLWNVKAVYLLSTWDVFGERGASYQLALDDGSTMVVKNDFFVATGGEISVLDKKCLHRISYPSFDFFTRCLPVKDEPVEGIPFDSPSLPTGVADPSAISAPSVGGVL